MRPLLHKRSSKDSSYDRLEDKSFLSYQSSTLSPNRSNFQFLSPRNRSSLTNETNDDNFLTIISFIVSILLLLWMYCQYQFIPSSSTTHNSYTKSFHHYQNNSISYLDFNAVTKTLNAKCTYAYLHSLSDIGDIHLSQSADAPFLQFLTLSDYGIIKHAYHRNEENVQSLLQLINVMNAHLSNNTHFIMSAGDIFYDNNVHSPHDSRWRNTFKHFAANKMFFAVAGNKDWLNISDEIDTRAINAQIQRTNWVNNWCLPKLYYTMRFLFDNKWTETLSFAVRFIALDTSSYIKDYNAFSYLKQQYEWLYNVLESNKNDDWIIVYGHHPFESLQKKKGNRKKMNNSKYTFEELQNMKVWKEKMEQILELLLMYDNVMIYISGHHHIWRVCHIMDKSDRLKLLTMITASAGRHNHHFNDGSIPQMIAGGEQESFGKITIYENMFRVQIIDKENETLFNRIYFKHKKVE